MATTTTHSKTTVTKSSRTSTNFLSLPAELRLRIYAYTMDSGWAHILRLSSRTFDPQQWLKSRLSQTLCEISPSLQHELRTEYFRRSKPVLDLQIDSNSTIGAVLVPRVMNTPNCDKQEHRWLNQHLDGLGDENLRQIRTWSLVLWRPYSSKQMLGPRLLNNFAAAMAEKKYRDNLTIRIDINFGSSSLCPAADEAVVGIGDLAVIHETHTLRAATHQITARAVLPSTHLQFASAGETANKNSAFSKAQSDLLTAIARFCSKTVDKCLAGSEARIVGMGKADALFLVSELKTHVPTMAKVLDAQEPGACTRV